MPAQGIVRPHWSDLAGQGPGDSLARLGLGERRSITTVGRGGVGGGRGARQPVPAERKGRAVAAPGAALAAFSKTDLGRYDPMMCPTLSWVLGGIEGRQKTEALCGGGRVREKEGRPARGCKARDAIMLHWFWMGRESCCQSALRSVQLETRSPCSKAHSPIVQGCSEC